MRSASTNDPIFKVWKHTYLGPCHPLVRCLFVTFPGPLSADFLTRTYGLVEPTYRPIAICQGRRHLLWPVLKGSRQGQGAHLGLALVVLDNSPPEPLRTFTWGWFDSVAEYLRNHATRYILSGCSSDCPHRFSSYENVILFLVPHTQSGPLFYLFKFVEMADPTTSGDRWLVVSDVDHRGIIVVVAIICCAYVPMILALRGVITRRDLGVDDWLAVAASVRISTHSHVTQADLIEFKRLPAYCNM